MTTSTEMNARPTIDDSADRRKERQAPQKPTMAIISAVVLLISLVLLMTDLLTIEARGVLSFATLLALILLRVPVGIALAITGVFGILSLRGLDASISTIAQLPWSQSSTWSLTVIPMFVMMGMLLNRSGAATGIFDGVRALFGRLPGGLAITTNLTGSGMGAASGSTLGITYALGRIALPEMVTKSGYDKRLASAAVLMAGTGGQLIPPSILLVIYAGIAQVPVGEQLAAGIIPGIGLAILYALATWLLAVFVPKLAPRDKPTARGFTHALRSVVGVWPVLLLVGIIVGGLYSGVFTATQAGAFGVVGAVFVVLVDSGPRKLAQVTMPAARDTAAATGAIFLVLIGGAIYARFMALSGVPQVLADWLGSVAASPIVFLLLVLVLYLVLGMVMDPTAMMLITVPILLPLAITVGVDPLVFGVLVVLLGELAVITPPVGILVFAVQRIAKDAGINLTLKDAFAGAMWFYPVAIGLAILLIFFPEIVQWLPALMG